MTIGLVFAIFPSMRARQNDFFKTGSAFKPTLSFGGTKSHAQSMRPLDRKRAVHVIMKSSRAKGRHSLLAHREPVDRAVHAQAKRFGVAIVSFANVGNHLHFVARFPHREAFRDWLRSTAGVIARIATGAQRGKPFGKFWDALALTRVIAEGRDFRGMMRYLELNRIEAEFGREARDIFAWKPPPTQRR